jgi:hypothetical protein
MPDAAWSIAPALAATLAATAWLLLRARRLQALRPAAAAAKR